MRDPLAKVTGPSPQRGKPKGPYNAPQIKGPYFLDSAIWPPQVLSPRTIALSLLTLLVYFNSLQGHFVHDDIFAIQRNEDITGQTPWFHAFWNDFWGKSMADNTSHKSYRPLTVLTFQMNYWLGGGQPFTFHVVNVFLHLFVVHLLVYVCHQQLHLDQKSAQLIGLLFAVHPVHSEAVAGIVGRADILAAFLFLLSFIFYAKGIQEEYENREGSSLQIYVSFILAASSMLCKETGITVLGSCLVYDCTLSYRRFSLQNKKMVSAFVRRIFKLLITIIVLLTFRMWIMANTLPAFKEEDNPTAFSPSFITRFLTYSHLCSWNGFLLLLPVTLCYDWQANTIQLIHSFSDPRNLYTLAFFILLTLITIKSLQFSKSDCLCRVMMSLIFSVLPFLPASNLFFPVGFVIAERVLYIPSIGYCIFVVHGLNSLEQKFQSYSKQISSIFLFICLIFSVKTWQQNKTWNSRESLFLSGLKALPQNAKVHYNYANLMKDQGQTEMAINHYQKVLSLWPKHASSHNNLGILLTDKKQARHHYEKALEISPQHISALINLGALLHEEGQTDEAILLMKKAVQLSGPNAHLYLTLGNLLARTNQLDEAESFFETAISMKPDYADAYNYYGSFFQMKGEMKKALEFYQKAMDQDSQHIRAMMNAAHSLEHLHQYDEAEMMLLKAMSVEPSPEIMDKLAMHYLNRGHLNKSLKVFEEILTDNHSILNNTDVILHYAQVLAQSNRLTEAKSTLSQLIKSQPSKANVKASILLSRIYGMQKLHKDAVELLSRIIQGNQATNVELRELYYERGNHQRDDQQYSQALSSYKQSLKLGKKNDGKTEFNIGTVHHLLGNFKEAHNYYKKAARLDPNNEHIMVNLQKLSNMELQEKRKIYKN